MTYVVIYLDDGRWTYAADSEDRDKALNALKQERVLHPEREYRMEVCSTNVFDAACVLGQERYERFLYG